MQSIKYKCIEIFEKFLKRIYGKSSKKLKFHYKLCRYFKEMQKHKLFNNIFQN